MGRRTYIVATMLAVFLAGCGGGESSSSTSAVAMAAPILSAHSGKPNAIINVLPVAACPPPPGAASPRAEVDLVDDTGSVMAVGPIHKVDAHGHWTGVLVVPPIQPGSYLVQAVCFTDPSVDPYAIYTPASFTVLASSP